MELTPKQQLFVQEYLVDLNATQAAIRAGYSPDTARSQGQRMLTNVDIEEEIQRAMDRRAERTGITADRVLQELAAVGFASMGDYLTTEPNGNHRFNFANLTRAQMAGIADVKIESDSCGRRKIHIKMRDKLAALIALGRHLERATIRDERSRAALAEEMDADRGKGERPAREAPVRPAESPAPEAAAAEGVGSVAQAVPKSADSGVEEVVPPIGQVDRAPREAPLPVAESSAPDAATAAGGGDIDEPSSIEGAAAAQAPPAGPAKPRKISEEEAERRFEAAIRAGLVRAPAEAAIPPTASVAAQRGYG